MNRDNQFLSLPLEGEIIEALASQNITEPTPIQRLVIPRILGGESVVVRAQTGCGKSLAYLIPIVQAILHSDAVRALVLLPTRELVQQLSRVARSLSQRVEVTSIYGGVEYQGQRDALAGGGRLIVATPGRLQDLLSQEGVEVDRVSHLVLDEVDQMVDMGFRDTLKTLLSQLQIEGAQRLCFTATLSPEVEGTIEEVVGRVDRVDQLEEGISVERIEQRAYVVEQSLMDQLLLHLLRVKRASRAIIFCRSRKMADRLAELLREGGYRAEAMHSDRSQVARDHILRRFTQGETTLLVASDLVARGVDVEGVDYVFNFGLPLTPEQYLHRIGRTGRAGASGCAISLIAPDERMALGAICAMMRRNIEVELTHPYMTPAVSRGGEPRNTKRARGRR